MRHETAGVENAGLDNEGGSRSAMQEWKMRHQI